MIQGGCLLSKYCFSQVKTVQKLFQSRRLFYQATSESLNHDDFLLKHKDKSVYCGYDPTSDSLHLGNLVSIIMMSRLKLLGLKPIFLVGGATGMIGDPSGKSKERNLLEEKIIQSNIASIQTQITKVHTNISNSLIKNQKEYQISSQELEKSHKNTFKIKNNYDFYQNLDAIRFLRDVGKYFRMGPLLSRQTVANRLKSQQGISYAQFSYSIIQAYDFFKLSEEEDCVLQFGGSDQWGNITNGCQLVRKKLNKQVFGITMPLLLTKSGQKFGKSEGNALFLNSQKTPIDQIHKYFLNSSDDQVENFLHIFTFYSESKITQIMMEHNKNKQQRFAQKTLSQAVISYLGDYSNKNNEFFTLSHNQLLQKDAAFFHQLFEQMKKNRNNYYEIKLSETKDIQGVQQLCLQYKLSKSKAEVKREVEKGGLYVNNRKMTNEDLNKEFSSFFKDNTLYNEFVLLRWGKKKYQFLKFTK